MYIYFGLECMLCTYNADITAERKDFNFQLRHRLSKFEVPVVVNLKHIFELFWALYHLLFDLETIGVN